MSEIENLRRTPLYDYYTENGAKLIDFGGWALPVQFSGIVDEHHAVRQHVGVFDVSHMGEVLVEGKDAENYLNYLLTNNISNLSVGRAQYNTMCYPDGGTVDDFIVYRLGDEKFLFVPNASNAEKDFEWAKENVKGDVTLENKTYEVGLLAVQGPNAETLLSRMTETELSDMKPFSFKEEVTFEGVGPVFVSRTGYTGEDGFELYVANENVRALWDKLFKNGNDYGLKPCGLGARDTLRLEARLALYGQDLTENITPIQAGIGFAVKTNPEKKESDFIGREALAKQREEGLKEKIVGIEVTGKGIARTGYPVYDESGAEEIGYVTSGTHSPTLEKSIALVMIPKTFSEVDTKLKIGIRKRNVDAVVVKTPFYKRG